MSSLMDRVKRNLREWYTLAADRTEEVAKVSARRYDKFGLSREIERQFSELGSFVYHAVGEGRNRIADDPTVLAIVERIKGLERDLEEKDQEIEEIRRARQQKQAEAADFRQEEEAATEAAAPGAAAAAAAGGVDEAGSPAFPGGQAEAPTAPAPDPDETPRSVAQEPGIAAEPAIAPETAPDPDLEIPADAAAADDDDHERDRD